ncbi:MAG: hypothetical protein LQ340_001279 [Diploschistes diacapsis]|nr:MAG: hypothetical protein LQ340_001279 [Diploschistes diacapsis]
MDMNGMDMSGLGMSGMDSDGAGLFTPENMGIAQTLWYIVAAFVGFLALLRVLRIFVARWRYVRTSTTVKVTDRYSVRRIRLRPDATPSKPDNYLTQAHATATAVLREMSYGQPWMLKGRFRHFTPPSAGRCLVIAAYWLIILSMLWSNVMLQPDDPLYGYKWEKVAFRAAWVSVTQVPFLFCLACKLNVVSLLSGISYERLNWFHRWASRTIFLTVIVHWSFFFTEWTLADFVNVEIQMMPMVTYGFAAWGVLGWMVLSSFGFFRSLWYELWVLQHLAAAGVFLWLLYLHVPAYATYNIWMAVAFVAFDQIGRFVWNAFQNLRGRTFGYSASLEAMPGSFTRVIIPRVGFRWKAGQHLYLTVPRLGLIEAHPFTIANAPDDNMTVTLYIKAHSGFSRRLYQSAHKGPYRSFVSGPWGIPPNLSSFETVIFICNSTGATFTLPLFQEMAKNRYCAKNVVFCWVCREPNQVTWFQKQLILASEEIAANGAKVCIQVAVTDGATELCSCCCAREQKISAPESCGKGSQPLVTEISVSGTDTDTDTDKCCKVDDSSIWEAPASCCQQGDANEKIDSVTLDYDPERPRVVQSVVVENKECLCALRSCGCANISCGARPSLDSVILPAVENARGETAVISCGGRDLTADVRSYVTRLSDERAVHKGSGAQGIYLWTEEYGW